MLHTRQLHLVPFLLSLSYLPIFLPSHNPLHHLPFSSPLPCLFVPTDDACIGQAECSAAAKDTNHKPLSTAQDVDLLEAGSNIRCLDVREKQVLNVLS